MQRLSYRLRVLVNASQLVNSFLQPSPASFIEDIDVIDRILLLLLRTDHMPDAFKSLSETRFPSFRSASRWKGRLLTASLQQPLDRVNVLGDERTGHTGYAHRTFDCKIRSVVLMYVALDEGV